MALAGRLVYSNFTQVTDSLSLTSPDGQELAITTKNINGEDIVSVFLDDGSTIAMIDIPKDIFVSMVSQLKQLH